MDAMSESDRRDLSAKLATIIKSTKTRKRAFHQLLWRLYAGDFPNDILAAFEEMECEEGAYIAFKLVSKLLRDDKPIGSRLHERIKFEISNQSP
jgi:hypothetical protein